MPKTDPRKATPTEACPSRLKAIRQSIRGSAPFSLKSLPSLNSLPVTSLQRRLCHRPTDCRVCESTSLQRLSPGLQRGGRESHEPFLTATPTACGLKAEAHPTAAWFDEYGTARELPTVRVVVSPTVWQKAVALLLALGCVLLAANLIVTILALSSGLFALVLALSSNSFHVLG